MYERILNFLIRNNFQSLNKILFKVFKLFLKKKIVLNHDDLLTSFAKFLKENNLKIFNSEFYEVKIEDLFYELKHLPKNIEVIGNYILSKNINFN